MRICMTAVVQHEWTKLRSIYKVPNSAFKAAKIKFTQSGTHESNFYRFCSGRVDVLYLYLHLLVKPGLSASVEADLPASAFLETEAAATATPAGFVSPRQPRLESGLDSLIKYSNDPAKAELTQKRLLFLAQLDITVRELEQERSAKRMLLDKEKTDIENSSLIFDQWRRVVETVASLKVQICRYANEEQLIALKEDLVRLQRKKVTLDDKI